MFTIFWNWSRNHPFYLPRIREKGMTDSLRKRSSSRLVTKREDDAFETPLSLPPLSCCQKLIIPSSSDEMNPYRGQLFFLLVGQAIFLEIFSIHFSFWLNRLNDIKSFSHCQAVFPPKGAFSRPVSSHFAFILIDRFVAVQNDFGSDGAIRDAF